MCWLRQPERKGLHCYSSALVHSRAHVQKHDRNHISDLQSRAVPLFRRQCLNSLMIFDAQFTSELGCQASP